MSVRFYCLTPAGQPLRLTMPGMALIHLDPCPVVIAAFANHSIRFAELVLRMVDRKPAGIERASYSLIRFGAKGRPDMDRFRRQSDASIRAHQDALLDHQGGPGNVVDMRDKFTGMGGRWNPTLQEAMRLEQAALGRIKVKTLRFDDETFDTEDDHPAPGPVAETLESRITDRLPFPLPYDVRLRKLHALQPKATAADIPLGRPVELVVLATKTTGATCRLLGREEVLTLRDDHTKDLIPGRVLKVQPDRVWSYQSNTYLSGEKIANRPYLRCLHGAGLCLWRLGFFKEAEDVYERMLWLNPADNQGARFILPEVRGKRDWQDFADAEKAGR